MALPYFTPGEVVVHNKPHDIWVSCLGRVYDLTPLIEEYAGQHVVKPLIAYAGKDISHLFDPATNNLIHRYHIVSGLYLPNLPHGALPQVHPQVPTTKWKPLDSKPWWDPKSKYVIGFLTEEICRIRTLNVLTGVENVLTVCKEDKLSRILERQLLFNRHIRSYTWKFEGRVLDMDKTMDENGIPDYRKELRDYGLRDDEYMPALMLYYNDDLTEL